MSDEVRDLDELQTAFNNFSCLVMAIAISGLADAAIVAHQQMNEHHSLAALNQLAQYARELRSGDALLKSVAALQDFDESEYPGDVDEVFDAGVRQGRIELARELLKLRQEHKDEEARRVHRYENRDAAKPETGTGGVSQVPEG